jgi:hypothetical protein
MGPLTAGPRAGNVYDQAGRFLAHLAHGPLVLWLLRSSPDKVQFVRWADTRRLPWPGQPDRTCDTVAWLLDLTAGGLPWLLVIEFQAEPDPEMFGRLLEYLGAAWRTLRPSDLRGDRFEVGGLVVNLTGRGQSGRTMRLADTGVRTVLKPIDRDMGALSAEKVLRDVRAGRAPTLALAFVPLMKKGGDPGMIGRWLEVARQVKEVEIRQALGLALVFAEKAGCGDAWREALKGWDVMESQIVKEWTAKARAEGEAEGAARLLVRVLEHRFKEVPLDLRAAIEAVKEAERLTAWADVALEARNLRQFRTRAGI